MKIDVGEYLQEILTKNAISMKIVRYIDVGQYLQEILTKKCKLNEGSYIDTRQTIITGNLDQKMLSQ